MSYEKIVMGVEQICNSLNFTIVFFKKRYIYAIFFSVKKNKGRTKKINGRTKKILLA